MMVQWRGCRRTHRSQTSFQTKSVTKSISRVVAVGMENREGQRVEVDGVGGLSVDPEERRPDNRMTGGRRGV